jgi:hypothetical protein
MRETLAVGNMTLQVCACSSGMMASTLSPVYNTRVLMLACESGDSVIECGNFTCPCNASRWLLQADQSVKVVYVYRAAPKDVALDALTRAIREAFVQSKALTTLSTNLLDYDQTLRTQGGELPLMWILVGAIVAAIVAACAWRSWQNAHAACDCKIRKVAAPPQSLTTDDVHGRFILIKLHET